MAKRRLSPEEVKALGLDGSSSINRQPTGSFSLEDVPWEAAGPVNSGDVPAASTPSEADAFFRGAGQGLTFGAGPQITGAIQALGQKYLPESWGGGGESAQHVSLGDLYRGTRDAEVAANAQAEAAHKKYFVGGNVVGGLGTAALGGPALKVISKVAPRAAAVWHGAGPMTRGGQALHAMRNASIVGGAGGGAYALNTSNADLTKGEFGQAAKDALGGAAMGAGLGVAVPAAAYMAGGLWRHVGQPIVNVARGGYVKPTPEAERLLLEGVPLTLGRMDPSSTFGRVEELTAKKTVGGTVDTMRQRAEPEIREMLTRKAGISGAAPPTRGAPVEQQLDQVRAGFNAAYDDVLGNTFLSPEKYVGSGKWRGLLTDPTMKGAAKTKGAFELAAADRGIDASPQARKEALGWLANQAQTLVPFKSGPNAGMVEARSIQSLRTKLKDKIRSLKNPQGDDRAKKEIYERALDSVDELLTGSLPPEKAAKLRDTDAHYRNLLALEDAADSRAAFKNDREFTSDQLLGSIHKKGATPEFEQLVRDSRNVMDATYPLTGVQAAADSAWLLKHAGPSWAAIANTSPTLKAHALQPLFSSGLPAKGINAVGKSVYAIGNAAGNAAMSPARSAAGTRTLYELLTKPRPAMSFADRQEDDLPEWARSP